MKILSKLINETNLKTTFRKGNKCMVKDLLIYKTSLDNKQQVLFRIKMFMTREINSKQKAII